MYRKLLTLAICMHVLTFVFLLFSPEQKKTLKNKSIAIRTIKSRAVAGYSMSPKDSLKASISQTPSQKIKKTSQTSLPNKNKKTNLPKKKKNVFLAKQKKTSSAILKQIDEALAKIEEPMYSSLKSERIKFSLPIQIESPADSSNLSGLELNKSDEEVLYTTLYSSLKLPEFGEVKLQVTIKKNGTVSNLKIMQSNSEKNKIYLETQLPQLKFPDFLKDDKTFTLIICNEN